MSQDLKNKMGIYQIINIIDGKRYIGSSNNLQKRRLEHFNKLKNNKHFNYYLQNAYNKYDLQNFKFEVLEFVESEDLLLSREQYYMELYHVCDRHKGYNLIVDATRNIPSEEIRKKMSEAHKGKYAGKNNPMYGKSHSLETRKKISEALKGKTGALSNRSKKVICLETGVVYGSILEAERLTGIHNGNICFCCKGRLKKAGGYHWQYYQK